ncbi:MAG: EamA family transporter RarD [Candidatus Cloacimonetes bacterium]|nr:EamA family transporter RarD [Candidatus Cloacimonadota bacterium]
MTKGAFFAIVAYTLWGLLPLFWKQLTSVPADQILCHRIIWSVPFLLFLLVLSRKWKWVKLLIQKPKTLLFFMLTALLLSVNWFTYIWSVNSGYTVDASLGYFINPLISVALGVIILKERLRPWQIIAIGIAALGVIYLTLALGKLPWIGLTLAISFGFYGLLRKLAPLEAVEGLFLETVLLLLPALLLLGIRFKQGQGSFPVPELSTTFYLIMAGIVTSIPLVFFAAGARRISLSSLGILQYIAPSLQFLLGVFVFREFFPQIKIIGFSIIWLALIIYSLENYFFHNFYLKLSKVRAN